MLLRTFEDELLLRALAEWSKAYSDCDVARLLRAQQWLYQAFRKCSFATMAESDSDGLA